MRTASVTSTYWDLLPPGRTYPQARSPQLFAVHMLDTGHEFLRWHLSSMRTTLSNQRIHGPYPKLFKLPSHDNM